MRQPRRKRGLDRNLPNPFAPGSPEFAERACVTLVEIGDGMSREDVGEPAGLVRDLCGRCAR